MKRIIAFLLVIIMILTCACSLAETEIQLPGGLEFGMELEKAVAISGFKKEIGNSYYGAVLEQYGFDNTYISGDGTIGGIETHIYGHFVDGKLKRIEYELKGEDKEALFKTVYEALETKYGTPLEEEKSTHQFSPFKSLLYKDNGYVYTYFPTVNNISTWAVDVAENSRIYIDTFSGTLMGSGNWLFTRDEVSVSYTYYDFRIDGTVNTDVSF